MTEAWKPVPGFPSYEVSDYGRVRSFRKRIRRGWIAVDTPQSILRQSKGDRHPSVGLYSDGRQYQRRIASLVLLAFISPPPEGMSFYHDNGDPSDNRLENLEYSVCQDAEKTRNELDDGQIEELRRRCRGGETQRMLADEFDVHYSTVSLICAGKRRVA